jgi:hypothetical protein
VAAATAVAQRSTRVTKTTAVFAPAGAPTRTIWACNAAEPLRFPVSQRSISFHDTKINKQLIVLKGKYFFLCLI